jgi:DNA ligase (NAD+)
LDGTEKAKIRPHWRLGIGIPRAETAKTLALRWPSLKKLSDCGEGELRSYEGIGEVVAASVQKFFQNGRNRRLADELETLGLRFVESAAADGPSAGKIFAINGTFFTFGRKELRRRVEAPGGSVRSALSRQVDLLLVGSAPGSKVAEAEKLGISIAEEEKLLEMPLRFEAPLREQRVFGAGARLI